MKKYIITFLAVLQYEISNDKRPYSDWSVYAICGIGFRRSLKTACRIGNLGTWRCRNRPRVFSRLVFSSTEKRYRRTNIDFLLIWVSMTCFRRQSRSIVQVAVDIFTRKTTTSAALWTIKTFPPARFSVEKKIRFKSTARPPSKRMSSELLNFK